MSLIHFQNFPLEKEAIHQVGVSVHSSLLWFHSRVVIVQKKEPTLKFYKGLTHLRDHTFLRT